jgi:hypothetical protein
VSSWGQVQLVPARVPPCLLLRDVRFGVLQLFESTGSVRQMDGSAALGEGLELGLDEFEEMHAVQGLLPGNTRGRPPFLPLTVSLSPAFLKNGHCLDRCQWSALPNACSHLRAEARSSAPPHRYASRPWSGGSPMLFSAWQMRLGRLNFLFSQLPGRFWAPRVIEPSFSMRPG